VYITVKEAIDADAKKATDEDTLMSQANPLLAVIPREEGYPCQSHT
jgi:hypothetical protein